LSALIYEGAFAADATDLAGLMEKRFQENGWPPQWRNGIYDFDHYHSQGHEVLGIAAGSARLLLGGDNGRELDVRQAMCWCFRRERATAAFRNLTISSSSAPIHLAKAATSFARKLRYLWPRKYPY